MQSCLLNIKTKFITTVCVFAVCIGLAVFSVEYAYGEELPASNSAESIMVLREDTVLSDPIVVRSGESLTIVAEGGNYSLGADATTTWRNKSMITVEAGGELIVGGNEYLVTLDGSNLAQVIKNGGKCTISSGVVIQGGVADYGGGINTSGVLTLKGTVQNCKANYHGGGVYVDNGGSATLFDGASISNNKSTMWGGGVSILGSFTMEGGTIANNAAESETTGWMGAGGGGVSVRNGLFVLNNGTIDGNSCASMGGGIMLEIDPSNSGYEEVDGFKMNGGKITNNVAGRTEDSSGSGGGVYVLCRNDNASISSGEISGNKAMNLGGGIYIARPADAYHPADTLTTYNLLVTNNTAELAGGGFWSCATGEIHSYITSGSAIVDNQTSGTVGAGDDIAIRRTTTASGYQVEISKRILGGGAVNYYNDGAFLDDGSSLGNPDSSALRYEPNQLTDLWDGDTEDDVAVHAVVSDGALSLAKAEAKVFVTDNTARRGGGIGTNGSFYVGKNSLKTKLTVHKTWSGSYNSLPDSVVVKLCNGNAVVDEVVLNAANNWTYTFDELPLCDADSSFIEYSIQEDPIEGFKTSIETVYDEDSNAWKSEITNTFEESETPENPETPGEPPVSDKPSTPDNTTTTTTTTVTTAKSSSAKTGDVIAPAVGLALVGCAATTLLVAIAARAAMRRNNE